MLHSCSLATFHPALKMKCIIFYSSYRAQRRTLTTQRWAYLCMLMMQEDWRQLSAWPSRPVSCSPATSGLMLALSMEQWELCRPSATGLEAHLTCPLLSWSTLTATLVPPFLTAPYPSLGFASAGPQEASAHVCSCPSNWHGQSPSTNCRVSPWTRWLSTLARGNSPQASHL